jgi:hypothetical protein
VRSLVDHHSGPGIDPPARSWSTLTSGRVPSPPRSGCVYRRDPFTLSGHAKSPATPDLAGPLILTFYCADTTVRISAPTRVLHCTVPPGLVLLGKGYGASHLLGIQDHDYSCLGATYTPHMYSGHMDFVHMN